MTPPGNSPAQSRGHALKNLVNHLIASLPSSQQGAGEDQLGLVYLGTVHDSIPRLLILDQGLRLEERCVWQIMRICIIDPARPASLLTQQQLAHHCCVDRKTLRRYLYALRANRWVTQCAKIHGRGTIWALHDEPLALPDTLLLDPDYMAFIQECGRSDIKRLREVGLGVLRTLQHQTAIGLDYSQTIGPLEQVARRMAALNEVSPSQSTDSSSRQVVGGLSMHSDFYAINAQIRPNLEHGANFPIGSNEVIHNGANFPTADMTRYGAKRPTLEEKFPHAEENSPQTENLVNAHTHAHGLNAQARGSNYLNNKNKYIKTTTTKHTNQDSAHEAADNITEPNTFPENRQTPQRRKPRPRLKPLDTYPAWVENLRWPQQIKPAERDMMLPALCAHDHADAQYLLNYLIDRLRAANRGEAPAVPNPVGYLCQIAALHSNGELAASSWGTRHPSQTQPTLKPKDKTETMLMSQEDKDLAIERLSQLKQKMGWRK